MKRRQIGSLRVGVFAVVVTSTMLLLGSMRLTAEDMYGPHRSRTQVVVLAPIVVEPVALMISEPEIAETPAVPLETVAPVETTVPAMAVAPIMVSVAPEAVSEESPATVERVMELSAPDAPELLLGESQVAVAWLVYDRLIEAGYTPEQIGGFLGNLYLESGLAADVYCEDGCHYGLAQWGDERLAQLQSWPNWWTAETQVDFLLFELQSTEKFAQKKIAETVAVAEAAVMVGQYYERPEWSAYQGTVRADYAQWFFDEMKLAQA